MNQKKISKEEKIVRLVDYLKQYTDSNHPASIPQIERYFNENYEGSNKGKSFFGDKNTRKTLFKELAYAMNSDVNGNLRPKEEWRIVYDDFLRDEGLENREGKPHHIVNIYYKEEFRCSEIDDIVQSIEKNDTLSNEAKEVLKEKVMRFLANKNHHKPPLTPVQRRAIERDTGIREARRKLLIAKKMRSYNNW